jgi:hypothetical protein
MSHLTIVYNGNTVFDDDVEAFSMEQDKTGRLYVMAGNDQPREETEPSDDDDRYGEFGKALLAKRGQDATA